MLDTFSPPQYSRRMRLTRQQGASANHFAKALLLGLICFAFVACGPSGPRQTRNEITGTQQERVSRATAILGNYCKLPGLILDAHMTEDISDNSGGMVPGPSDVWLSGVFVIPTGDLAIWREALSPEITPAPSPSFTSPLAPPPWWPATEAFDGCEFYSPKMLTGRSGGFVALSPSASTIYFSTTRQ